MATFVLKLAGNPRGELCGTLCRVSNGETRPFADSSQLLACLAEWSTLERARATGIDELAAARLAIEAERPPAPDSGERKQPCARQ